MPHLSLSHSLRTFLYMSAADIQLVYTPPLYSSPLHTPQSSDGGPLPTLITGHSLEANFSNNFTIFIGQDQVGERYVLSYAPYKYLRTMYIRMYVCSHVYVCV